MAEAWFEDLNVNPLPLLLQGRDEALEYFVRRDLLQEAVPPGETLWELPEATRLVRQQRADGAWQYPGKTNDAPQNYALLQTYRNLRVMVEKYQFTASHAALRQATDYIFSCQTAEGDIRGIIGNQYMPYYHGAILELLIKAGYADDARLTRGLDWLLAMRQEDGGWIVPAQAVPPRQRSDEFWSGPPALTIVPDFFITGLLAIFFGLLVLVWSLAFVQRRHGGLVLILLSVALLLFGGGFFPPLIGLVGAVTGTQINRTAPPRPGAAWRFLAALWPWPLLSVVTAYAADAAYQGVVE